MDKIESITYIAGSAGLPDPEFLKQFEDGVFPSYRLKHFDHVRLAWLYTCNFPYPESEARIHQSIQAYTKGTSIEIKYHFTVTTAWMRLIRLAVYLGPEENTFRSFVEKHQWLLNRGLLQSFYSKELLASDIARRSWVPPDLKVLPPVE